jgi:hypothetical protein
MSEPETINGANQFAQTAIPLLKEYSKKLDDISEKAHALRETRSKSPDADHKLMETDVKFLGLLFNRLKPPASNLARHVSQLVEHGNLDDLTRLELILRLAEFESALLSAEGMINLARTA